MQKNFAASKVENVSWAQVIFDFNLEETSRASVKTI